MKITFWPATNLRIKSYSSIFKDFFFKPILCIQLFREKNCSSLSGSKQIIFNIFLLKRKDKHKFGFERYSKTNSIPEMHTHTHPLNHTYTHTQIHTHALWVSLHFLLVYFSTFFIQFLLNSIRGFFFFFSKCISVLCYLIFRFKTFVGTFKGFCDQLWVNQYFEKLYLNYLNWI